MTKNIDFVGHKKSKLKTIDGKPQLPSADSLVEGEIAINYAEGVETLSIKNESGSVVTFSSDESYTKEKLGSAFIDNNVTVTDELDEMSAVTEAAMTDLEGRTSDIEDMAVGIPQAISGKVDTTAMTLAITEATSGKADNITVETISNALTAHTANTAIHVTASEKTAWNNKSDFSGNYNNLTNKPTIPSSASQVTNDTSYVPSTVLDEYASKAYVDDALNSVPLETAGATAISDFTCARLYEGETSPTLGTYYGSKTKLYEVLDHFKIGIFDKDGKLVKECAPGRLTADKNGGTIAIDGSMGDVMLYTDADIYVDRASLKGMSVPNSNGTTASTYNVIGLGLTSHSVVGKNAKKFEPFSITPHATVNCKLSTDSKTQAHSIYNKYVAGTYAEPTPFFTTAYRADGKGFPTTSIGSLRSSYYAREKGGGYMGLYYEFYEIWLMAMYLELGTLDFTSLSKFGNGCAQVTPDSSAWFSDTTVGSSGARIKHTGGDLYSSLTHQAYGTGGASGNTRLAYGLTGGDDYCNFTEMLETQRIMDGVVKAGYASSISGTKLFTFNNSGNVVTAATNVNVNTGANMVENKKYFTVRNVTGCKGLADGVMTGVVNIYMKKVFASGVTRSGTNVGGDTVIFKFSHPVYRGLDLLSSAFVQLEGLYFVINAEGDASLDGTSSAATSQDFYYAEHWSKVPKNISTTSGWCVSDLDGIPKVVSGLTYGYSLTTFTSGWIIKADYNMSLYAHNYFGASQHTYECGYIRKDATINGATTSQNSYPTHGHRYAKCSPAGVCANVGWPGRTLYSYYSAQGNYAIFSGGFSHPQITL